MSISADSPSDETLNRGPLALLLRRQYEFPFGINIVQFSIFFYIEHKRVEIHSRKVNKELWRKNGYCGSVPFFFNQRVRANAVSSHLAKTASKSGHPFGWNIVHWQTSTQTNCSQNVTFYNFVEVLLHQEVFVEIGTQYEIRFLPWDTFIMINLDRSYSISCFDGANNKNIKSMHILWNELRNEQQQGMIYSTRSIINGYAT